MLQGVFSFSNYSQQGLFFYFYLFYFISFAQKNTNNNLNIRAGTPQQLEPITADPKNKKI